MNEPKRLSIKQAAPLLEMSEQELREHIKRGNIKGAICFGGEKRRKYYITDVQIFNFKRGMYQ